MAPGVNFNPFISTQKPTAYVLKHGEETEKFRAPEESGNRWNLFTPATETPAVTGTSHVGGVQASPTAGGVEAAVAQYKQEWISGITGAGDSYYTNNPDKSKAYSKIPSFMMMG